jgi:hypothetical protein
MSVPVINRDTRIPSSDVIQSCLFQVPSVQPIGIQLHGMDGAQGQKGEKGDCGEKGDKGEKGDQGPPFTCVDEHDNIAIGTRVEGSKNIAIGVQSASTTTGTNNIILGYGAKSSIPTISNEIVLGNASITALRCQQTAIAGLSDERDKTNITTLDSTESLEFIRQLRPVEFQWDMREWYDDNVSDQTKLGTIDIGFIAQDILAVDQKDSYRIVSTANPERYEVAPARLLPLLVSAIQELEKKVKILEERF